ncbi:MAG: ribonuclease P protein component [Flavobacteriales bacterium]
MLERYTLGKNEKLKSKKNIDKLFSDGKSFVQHPVRIVYIKNQSLSANQVAFSVSKRNFKLAVDRNRIKRLMREAYRLNKHDLNQKGIHIIFIYTDIKMKSYPIIERSIKKILTTLQQ